MNEENLLPLAKAELFRRWAKGEVRLPQRKSIAEASGEPVGLSVEQMRMWRSGLADPADAGRNLYIVLELAGVVDESSLRHASRFVVERHDVLRSFYPARAGEPQLEYAAVETFELERVDLQAESPEEARAALDATLSDWIERPFNLAAPPLFRAVFFRWRDDVNWLLLLADHIIFDGWSLSIVLREFEGAYNAHKHGVELSLSRPRGFSDYVRYVKNWDVPQLRAQATAYVERLLRQPEPFVRLPTARPRSTPQPFSPGKVAFCLPEGVASQVQSLAREMGETPYTLLSTALGLVVSRIAGHPAVLMYSPTANRPSPEFGEVVGLFRSFATVRFDYEPERSWSNAVAQLRTQLRDSASLQLVPSSFLVEEALRRGVKAVDDLFHICFVMQNFPRHPLSLSGVAADVRHVSYGGGGELDLSVVFEDATSLSGYMRYNSALFDRDLPERVIDSMSRLIEEASQRRDTTLKELANHV